MLKRSFREIHFLSTQSVQSVDFLSFFRVLLCFFFVVSAKSDTRHPTSDIAYSFRLERAAEVGLAMRASAPDTSWRQPGAEAAVVRIELDGRYSQHVTLFMGSERHEYRVLLGPLRPGEHRLVAGLDARLSSPGARAFTADFRVDAIEQNAGEYDAVRRAPVVYARPDTLGRASDVPMLSYYEDLPASSLPTPGAAPAAAHATRVLQYTYIFSNEDGGTDTPALMARWGRTVDIEYVYRGWLDRTGALLAETFQAADHKDLPFRGRKLGLHPLVRVAAKNNIFSDALSLVPDNDVRIALWPERADLSQHSREELLDRHPWTYRVMIQEVEREGRLTDIAHPREFLYLEARLTNVAAESSFAAQVKDGRLFRGDRGRPALRIERSGWVRTAVELAPGVAFEDVDAIVFFCDPPRKPPPSPPREAFCVVEAISKMFLLGHDDRPGPTGAIKRGLPARLAPGESRRF